jgi:hypothetical protein
MDPLLQAAMQHDVKLFKKKKKGTYNGKKGKDIVLGRANLVVASFIVRASHYNNSLRLFWRNVLLFGSHGF